MHRGHRIAVVIPAYQERKLIQRTLRSVPAFVDSIHVVDDASDDDTAEQARSLGDGRVDVTRHGVNSGVGSAIITGYRRALQADAEVLVVMAGDNQMDPADLPALLAPVIDGEADYVKGNRFLHAQRHQMPPARRVAGRLLAALTRRATGLSIGDSQCGYTALSRRAALELPLEELYPRYGYPNDLLGLLAAAHCTVTEVPVRPVYEDEASGVRPYHALVVAGVILRRWLRSRGPQLLRRFPESPAGEPLGR